MVDIRPINPIRIPGPMARHFEGIADQYARGQDRAQRERQMQFQQRKYDDALKAQEAQQQAKEERARELVSSHKMLATIGQLQKIHAEGGDEAYAQAYPQYRARLMQEMEQVKPGEQVQMPDQPVPIDQLQIHAQGLRRRASTLSDPQKYEAWMKQSAEILAAEVGDDTLNDPQFARQHPKWKETLNKVLFEEPRKRAAERADRINISQTNEPLEKGFRSKMQAEAKNYESNIAVLEEQLEIPNEMFGLKANIKRSAGKVADFLGVPAEETIDFAAKQQAFFKGAKRNNLQILNQISGATVSPEEHERFEDVFGNPDKYGPLVYKATVRELIRLYKKDLALNRRIRGQGLEVDRGEGPGAPQGQVAPQGQAAPQRQAAPTPPPAPAPQGQATPAPQSAPQDITRAIDDMSDEELERIAQGG